MIDQKEVRANLEIVVGPAEERKNYPEDREEITQTDAEIRLFDSEQFRCMWLLDEPQPVKNRSIEKQ